MERREVQAFMEVGNARPGNRTRDGLDPSCNSQQDQASCGLCQKLTQLRIGHHLVGRSQNQGEFQKFEKRGVGRHDHSPLSLMSEWRIIVVLKIQNPTFRHGDILPQIQRPAVSFLQSAYGWFFAPSPEQKRSRGIPWEALQNPHL